MLMTDAMNIVENSTRNVNPQLKLCGIIQIAAIAKPTIDANMNDEVNGAAFQPFHIYDHLL